MYTSYLMYERVYILLTGINYIIFNNTILTTTVPRYFFVTIHLVCSHEGSEH